MAKRKHGNGHGKDDEGNELTLTEHVFRDAWEPLAHDGLVDDAGGEEYQRVYQEWLSNNRPAQIGNFIRQRANQGPQEEVKSDPSV